MSHITLVIIAVLATTLAQILLKKASIYDAKTFNWLLLMGFAASSYAFSFVLYSRVLKYFPINKVYPAMTVGQLILITIFGLMIGEAVGVRHAIGLVLGALAIYFVMS